MAEPRRACGDSDPNSLHRPTLFDGPGPPYVLWSSLNRVLLPLQGWRSCLLELRSSWILGFCFHCCQGQVSEKNIPTLTTPDYPTGESLLPEGEFHEEGEKSEAPFSIRPHMAMRRWLSTRSQSALACWVLLVMHPLQGPTILHCFKQPIK